MMLGWPQIIYLALSMLSVGVALGKHGEPRPVYNVGYALTNSGIALGLLWWGGFFGSHL